MAASNGSEYFELEIEGTNEVLMKRPSNAESVEEDEEELQWAALERLPSMKRKNTALLRRTPSNSGGDETIDVRKLTRSKRELVVKNALATSEQDNYRLLSAIKERLDRYEQNLSLRFRFFFFLSKVSNSIKIKKISSASQQSISFEFDALY